MFISSAVILRALDGVALNVMVDVWANAPTDHRQSSHVAPLAVRQIEIGTASSTAILFGAAVLLLVTAVVISVRYPSWLGWLGVAGGIGTIAGGNVGRLHRPLDDRNERRDAVQSHACHLDGLDRSFHLECRFAPLVC